MPARTGTADKTTQQLVQILRDLIANFPPPPTSVQGGTWEPMITPDPTGWAHSIAGSPPPSGFFQRIGNVVSVTVLYSVNTTSTLGVTQPWGDLITLPIPHAPFATQFDAAGTVVVGPVDNGDAENGGAVATELGGGRLNPIYRLLSVGGTVVRVSVQASYSLN